MLKKKAIANRDRKIYLQSFVRSYNIHAIALDLFKIFTLLRTDSERF